MAVTGTVRVGDLDHLVRGESRVEDHQDAHGDQPPTAWAPMKGMTDDGAMPANVSENIRPTVIAGLAKLVDDVKK